MRFFYTTPALFTARESFVSEASADGHPADTPKIRPMAAVTATANAPPSVTTMHGREPPGPGSRRDAGVTPV